MMCNSSYGRDFQRPRLFCSFTVRLRLNYDRAQPGLLPSEVRDGSAQFSFIFIRFVEFQGNKVFHIYVMHVCLYNEGTQE